MLALAGIHGVETALGEAKEQGEETQCINET